MWGISVNASQHRRFDGLIRHASDVLRHEVCKIQGPHYILYAEYA